MEQLYRLGWNEAREQEWRAIAKERDSSDVTGESSPLVPARISVVHGETCALVGEGPPVGRLSGRLRHLAEDSMDLPAVGDWVAVRPAATLGIIERVLARRSVLSRRRVGARTQAQVVATNVDFVLVVSSVNRDFNPRRIERYLTTIWASGATPMVVLSKVDLCPNLAPFRTAVEPLARGLTVVATSTATGAGLVELRALIGPGRTAALVGSSGVGKSSLVNALTGADRQVTLEIRAGDDKGRHATTRRELIELPGGGVLIDTPGMREVGLWDAQEGADQAFDEVEQLAHACRFRDCRHDGEPGCAVRAAVDSGTLDADRLASYDKLRREQAYVDRQRDAITQGRAKSRWKSVHRQMRARRKVDPKLRED